MKLLEYTKIINDKDGNEFTYIDGIETTHPDYDVFSPRWKKARDVIAGEETLKGTGNREYYLPRLNGHTNTTQGNADYTSFVEYAELFNATGRSVEAYRGLLNRKLPFIKLPSKVKDLIKAFTIKDESIYTFMEQIEVETIVTNRVGLFIDHPYVDTERKLTKHEAQFMNMSPYGTMYTAESIINWEEKRVNNRIMTSLVVLKEEEYVRVDSFVPEIKITYRVLELDAQGYYRQVIIEPSVIVTDLQKQGMTKNVIKDVIYPKQDGKLMTFIPFYPVTAQGVTWELSKSVISDLVNVNIAHFRNTAFHEKAIMWTASPTAVFSGLPTDTQSIGIGSTEAVIIAPGGTAKYLEYEGRGLDDIKIALDKKEQQMAILGAKILANEVNGIESGEAAMIHRAGEQGILADIATTIGTAMEKLIEVICAWRKVDFTENSIVVEITKDYTPAVIDANTVIALGKEVAEGRLSYESYVGAMQRGEIIPATRDAKAELKLIAKTHEGTILTNTERIEYLEKKGMTGIIKRAEELEEQANPEPIEVAEPKVEESDDKTMEL